MNDMAIDEIEKNATEKIRVSLSRFHGRDYIDLRTYYPNPITGEMRFGRQGIALHTDLLDRGSTLSRECAPRRKAFTFLHPSHDRTKMSPAAMSGQCMGEGSSMRC